jgi:serine/threonine protein kinase
MDAPFTTNALRFEKPLGQGGTAQVARVTIRATNRLAAVKYPLSSTTEYVAEFCNLAAREHTLIGRFLYPGIVRLLDRPSEDPAYILLELCAGPTLDLRSFPLDMPEAMNILSAVAVNLEFLRANGVVHGDLKAGNVFLPASGLTGGQGAVPYTKLSDFSMGRTDFEPDGTRAGLGTVGYLAPEVITDNRTSHQSDLYALGVIAYQLLTGVHPFLDECDDPHEINRRAREDDFVALKNRRQDLSEPLSELVGRLMHPEVEERPATAWDVCLALEQAGAEYAFRRALRPAHFFLKNESFDSALGRTVSDNPEQVERVRFLTGGDCGHLRLLLTANFIRGNLYYDKGAFRFENTVYWPSRFRHSLLATIPTLPLSEKRKTVLQAVKRSAGEPADAGSWKNQTLSALLEPLLSISTVKRLSRRLLTESDKSIPEAVKTRLCVQAGDFERAEESAWIAAHELSGNHDHAAAVRVLNAVIELAEMKQTPFEARRLYLLRGTTQKAAGDVNLALETFQRLERTYEGHDPDKLLAETYKHIGTCHRLRQQPELGLEALESARDLFEQLGDELEIASTLNQIGNIHFLSGDFGKTRKCYRQALRIQRGLKAWPDIASTLNNLAPINFVSGHYRRAESLFRMALAIQRELGDSGEIARTLNNLGYALSTVGDMKGAAEALEESLQLNRRTGSRKELLINLDNLTSFSIAAGMLKESLAYIREGLQISGEVKDLPHQGVFQVRMGAVFLRTGQYDKVRECFDEADRVLSQLNDPVLLPTLHLHQAQLDMFVGNRSAARVRIEDVLRKAKEAGDAYTQSDALVLLSRIDPHCDIINSALELCRSLHRIRDARLVRYNALEANLELGEGDDALALAGELADDELESFQDIEVPRMASSMAEACLLRGEHDESARYLTLALARAKEGSMEPDLIGVYALYGKLHYERDEYEAC